MGFPPFLSIVSRLNQVNETPTHIHTLILLFYMMSLPLQQSDLYIFLLSPQCWRCWKFLSVGLRREILLHSWWVCLMNSLHCSSVCCFFLNAKLQLHCILAHILMIELICSRVAGCMLYWPVWRSLYCLKHTPPSGSWPGDVPSSAACW